MKLHEEGECPTCGGVVGINGACRGLPFGDPPRDGCGWEAPREAKLALLVEEPDDGLQPDQTA